MEREKRLQKEKLRKYLNICYKYINELSLENFYAAFDIFYFQKKPHSLILFTP